MRRLPCCGDDRIQYFLQAWIRCVSRMEFYQSRGAFRVKQKLQCVLSSFFRRSQGVKCRSCADFEVFTAALVIVWSRGNDGQQRFWEDESRRLECSQD